MPPLNVGVLGAAKIADKSTVPAMLATEGVSVAGVAARDSARAQAFATKHDIPVFDSYQEIIDDPAVDAVYVPLPVGLHAQWALAAIAAGKDVLVEKSLAGTLADCLEVIDAARAAGVVIVENFMCERHPQNTFIREGLASGIVGELHHATLSFGFPAFPPDDLRNSARLGGGALNDAGAYCLDMATYYSGRAPEAVTARLAAGPHGVDVVGSAFLEYDDELTVSVSFGFGYDYRNEARFWGASGQLEVDRCFSIPPDRPPAVSVTRNTVREDIELAAADQFRLQIEYFRDLAVAGGPAVARELDARERHARVMEAVRVSARERRRVLVNEVMPRASARDASR